MSLSKMFKRLTSDFKYMFIAAAICLSIVCNVIAFFDIVSNVGKVLLVSPYIISAIAEISLLIYALNFHGTKGSKLTLYIYYVLQCACILSSAFSNKLVGIAAGPIGTSVISLAMFLLMIAVIFLGIRGLPVYLLTVVIAVFNYFSVSSFFVRMGGFPGLLPFISIILPSIVVLISCYLVATSTKR